MRNTDEKELLKWAYFENTGLYWTTLKLAGLYWSCWHNIFQFLNHMETHSSKCTGFYSRVPKSGLNMGHCNDSRTIRIYSCTEVHKLVTKYNHRGRIADMLVHHTMVPSSVADRDTVRIGIGHVYKRDCKVLYKLLSWLFLDISICGHRMSLPDRNRTDSWLLGNLYQQKRFHLRPSLYRLPYRVQQSANPRNHINSILWIRKFHLTRFRGDSIILDFIGQRPLPVRVWFR